MQSVYCGTFLAVPEAHQTGLGSIEILRERPSNIHRLSESLGLDYKGAQHHISVLENNLRIKAGEKYGVLYFISELFATQFGSRH